MRNHLIITGTGRAGTTFLVQLLHGLGLDTGMGPNANPCQKLKIRYHKSTRCGLEFNVRNEEAPYVCKDPHFCIYANEVFARKDIRIDYVLLPVRDLHEAAESRRCVNKVYGSDAFGGLLNIENITQEEALLQRFYKLLYATSKVNVPVILMQFPLMVQDSRYVYDKLAPIISDVAFDTFESIFKCLARPDWAHNYRGLLND